MRSHSFLRLSTAATAFFAALTGFAGLASAQWTGWLNRDNPGGSGDWEHLAAHIVENGVCAAPIDIQCQTLGGVDWTLTGEVVTCTPGGGLVCLNAAQPDNACMDYRVNFLCPVQCAQTDWPQQAGQALRLGVEQGNSVAVDELENVYVTGGNGNNSLFGTSTHIPGPGFLAKYDRCGDLQWARNLKGVGYDVVQDDLANSYVVGRISSGMFLTAYDVNGSYLWQIGNTTQYLNGMAAIDIDENGLLYIATYYNGTVTFPTMPGGASITMTSTPNYYGAGFSDDSVVLIYDTAGHLVDAIPITSAYNDRASGIAVEASGDSFYVTGTYWGANVDFGANTLTPAGGWSVSGDLYVVKYDASGLDLWAETANQDYVRGLNLDLDVDTNELYLVSTCSSSTAFSGSPVPDPGAASCLVKYDDTGAVEWVRGFGRDLRDVHFGGDHGGAFASGATFSSPANAVLLKVDDVTGASEWEDVWTGALQKAALGLSSNGNGVIYATGFFSSTINIAGTTLTSFGLSDIFVAQRVD